MSSIRISQWSLAVLALTCLVHSRSLADDLLGMLLSKHDGKDIKTMFQDPKLWDTIIRKAWNANHPEINKAIEQKLPEANKKLPKKVSIYQQHSYVSGDCQLLESSFQNNTMFIRFLVKNNRLVFKTTTDSIFGAYADPKFEFTYNLEIEVNIDIPKNLESWKANSVKAKLGSFSWKTKNVLVAIVSMLKGTGFITDAITGKSFDLTVDVNRELAGINKEIAKLKKEGYWTLSSKIEKGGKLLGLTAYKPTRHLGKIKTLDNLSKAQEIGKNNIK